MNLTLSGYRLSTGATIFGYIYAMHHDRVIWGNSLNFKPERVLNEDGRKCIMETFSRDVLFLFVTNMYQTFTILSDPDSKGNVDFEADFGLSLAPKRFKIVLFSKLIELFYAFTAIMLYELVKKRWKFSFVLQYFLGF